MAVSEVTNMFLITWNIYRRKTVKLTFGKGLSNSQITPHIIIIMYASFDLGTDMIYEIC